MSQPYPTPRATQDDGSARSYQGTFVTLAALDNPGYGPIDGQPAVYSYIATFEVNALNCRIGRVRSGTIQLAILTCPPHHLAHLGRHRPPATNPDRNIPRSSRL
jgi:hypothetical protein